jgi:hypothetical protein
MNKYGCNCEQVLGCNEMKISNWSEFSRCMKIPFPNSGINKVAMVKNALLPMSL